MKWHQWVLTALAVLLLAGGNRVSAEKRQQAAKAHDRLAALAEKLGLSSDQKEHIRKIHHDYDQKEDQVEAQIRHLRHEEFEALEKVLTPDQRKQVPGVLKAEREKELHAIGDKLHLSDQQKERIHKVRADYDSKIDKLAASKRDKAGEQIRHLRHQEFAAIHKELNEEQRAQVPGLFREEMRTWRDQAARRQRLKAVADKLGLSEDQRKQAKEVHAKYDSQTHQLHEQLRDLHRQEHEAISKVLTDEQRQKMQELRKGREGGRRSGS